MIENTKIKSTLLATLKGAIGIVSEVLLIMFFICAGFAICFLWWGIFK